MKTNPFKESAHQQIWKATHLNSQITTKTDQLQIQFMIFLFYN